MALGKPSGRDESSWYFQRFVHHLPVGGEMVIFNRSWYNRAGGEIVMGFCTPAERESFMEDAPRFEELLVRSGTLVRKVYLDIGKAEQERRLADRARDPLKKWKVSPIDEVAVKNWEHPDPQIAEQRVVFGTSGHRGSSFSVGFNEAHILAITQAICSYRKHQQIDGPLFLGWDTHALSEPARASALEAVRVIVGKVTPLD